MAEAETTAWVAAVVGDGGTVSGSRQGLVDALIVSLKADGIFTKLDRLWLFKAENSQSALRDLVAASAATAVLSPTFTVDAGYQSDGATNYINTNFNSTTAPSPKYVRDSATFFGWSNYSTGTSAPLCGTTDGNTVIYPRSVADAFFTEINDSSFIGDASTDAKGFWAANRSASNATQAYKNGASIGSGASASVAPSNQAFLAFNVIGVGFWPGIILAVGIGQSLTAGEHLNLYTRLNTYMTGGGYAAFSIPQLDGRTVTQMIGY